MDNKTKKSLHIHKQLTIIFIFVVHTQEFVDEVLKTVELDEIKYTLVGRPGMDGLSLEQRKRLTVAVELVSNPSVILMDEPTTGLDARSAAIVIRAVKNISETGRTVVCTIHQPSTEIFEAFDEVFKFLQYIAKFQ
jgi:ABC-type multidrug transport system ATPase subunit